jgi:hypothetical protein
MPDVHFWLICLRAFIVAFAGMLTTSLVQLSGTTTPIAPATWLTALLGGAVAAANAGHAAWPETPAPASPTHSTP